MLNILLGLDTTQILLIVLVPILIVVVFVLPMINQRKQQKQYSTMLASVSVGDKIKTIGGIVGKIVALDEIKNEKFIVVEIAEGVRVTFDIKAVYQTIESVNKPTPVVEAADNATPAVNAEEVFEEAAPTAEVIDEVKDIEVKTEEEPKIEVKKEPKTNYSKSTKKSKTE